MIRHGAIILVLVVTAAAVPGVADADHLPGGLHDGLETLPDRVCASGEQDVACRNAAVSDGGDARAGNLAVSRTGDATCEDLVCAAASGDGEADGLVAASGTGRARGAVAASGTGPAAGDVAASATGDVIGIRVGVSGTGDARGPVAASGTGHASGDVVGASGCEAGQAAGTEVLCLDADPLLP